VTDLQIMQKFQHSNLSLSVYMSANICHVCL